MWNAEEMKQTWKKKELWLNIIILEEFLILYAFFSGKLMVKVAENLSCR